MRNGKLRFRVELTLLVLLKLGLLYLIKILFFNHPLAPHMQVAPEQIERQFFGSPATQPSSAPGVRHGLT